MTTHWRRHRSRCHDCDHPGRTTRRVNARKKPCDCPCHRTVIVPVREPHSWPGWVDGDTVFEAVAS